MAFWVFPDVVVEDVLEGLRHRPERDPEDALRLLVRCDPRGRGAVASVGVALVELREIVEFAGGIDCALIKTSVFHSALLRAPRL